MSYLIINDLGLSAALFAAYLAAATGVWRMAAGVYDWTMSAVGMQHPAGYVGIRRRPRQARYVGLHAGSDRMVADYEVEHGGPWRAGECTDVEPPSDVDVHDIGDGTQFAAELHAIAEQIRAEETGEIAPIPLSGVADETIVALQERTAVLPVLNLHELAARRATVADFDELLSCECKPADGESCHRCLERALLAEERVRLERLAATGLNPIVIPRQREAAAA